MRKRAYGSNIYKTWVETGKLDEVLSFIKDCSKRLVTQVEMCKYLKINPSTFSSMKKTYPIIQETIDSAKYDLKVELASAMYKKAVGYETIEEDQLIEEKDGRTKKKVHRVKKQIGPDYKALVYLLSKHFGKKYGERYEELSLMEKKINSNNEVWSSLDTSEDDESNDGDSFI